MMGRYSLFNQAELGSPATGPYGNGLKEMVRTTTVINRAAFLPAVTYKFRELYGPFAVRPAQNIMRPAATHGYQGIYPLEEQPMLTKPKPWQDRTLGAG